jgi:hypothetical protein
MSNQTFQVKLIRNGNKQTILLREGLEKYRSLDRLRFKDQSVNKSTSRLFNDINYDLVDIEDILKNITLNGPKYIDERKCAVCMEDFNENKTDSLMMNQYNNKVDYTTLHCGHRFHKECIVSWFKVEVNCPICRSSIV